ncbi:MAG: HEAT repeat domain-containing protein [Sedimentisphaerales bacterium]|nr:HEAT repeat domain-containing protein [Sedimentisphaerales bacterium]
MFYKSPVFLAAFLVIVMFLSQPVFSQDVEDDWNDFLHYTAIGRFDLAAGFAQKIIDSDPDPIQLLTLSEENTNGYRILLKMNAESDELRALSSQILAIIEKGRYLKRTDPRIIVNEIQRLSTTIRGRIAAEQRLRNAGEFAIPLMLDGLADLDRKSEFANIAMALPKVGRDAIRPLVTALQMDDTAVKAEVIRALGDIGYPQPLGHLKYVVENDDSPQLRALAAEAIEKIDSSAMNIPAAELLFMLGRSYYFHNESLAPSSEIDYANIWFWDAEERKLIREEVDKGYFNELMAMRSCEWALKADENIGKAIALWVASFFKAESSAVPQPNYFGDAHLDAMAYAMTAGPEYLHQALDMALKEKNAYVSLGLVEALAANAGEMSLMYRIGVDQPIVKALSFEDTAVRYSAAIAIGSAGPVQGFVGSERVVENLAQAIGTSGNEELGENLADLYALRAVRVMLKLATTRNKVVNLSHALSALADGTKDSRKDMQILSGQVLAYINDAGAQQAIAAMALLEDNDMDVRNAAFRSLAISAKLNTNLLNANQIDSIYALIGSDSADAQLRSTAAGAYGALNLPSSRVKNLILDQAVN